MTIWSWTETILKRGKNGKNWPRYWDQDFHPNNVIVAKLGILLLHVHDQIHHPVGVAELVVIPGDQLHKSWRQLNSSLGIHNGRPGVAEDALEGPSLTGSLEHRADLVTGGWLLQANCQVDDRNIRSGHPECHACQFPIQLRDNLAHGLGCPSGGGDDVLGSAATSPPVLSAGSVNSLLRSRSSVDSGHQTLQDAIVVMDHLGKGSQAVGCAGGVGDNLHVLAVAALVHTHHKHGRVGRGGGNDNLLSSSLVMLAGSLKGGGHAS